MNYHDPNEADPEFPDRPKHQDFQRLSNTVQGMDMRATGTAEVSDIIGLDVESVDYFIKNRLGILSEAIGLDLQNPLIMAIYMDALTVGTLAERAR